MVALVIGMTGSLHRIWWLYLAVILSTKSVMNKDYLADFSHPTFFVRKSVYEKYGMYIMSMKYLFSFDKVAFGGSVIIYGYGKLGKSYIEQIEMTGYCKIVAIVDGMGKLLNVSKYKVIDFPASWRKSSIKLLLH